MSGPLILAVRRRGDRDDPAEPHEALTWAELAWSIIGFYWIGLTVLVVPVRLPHTRLRGHRAARGLPHPGRPRAPTLRAEAAGDAGTRPGLDPPAGVVLLVSWPIAWLAMILLGKTL